MTTAGKVWADAYAQKRYEERKAARRCVRCDAGLQEGDGVLCVDCSEAQAAYVPPKKVKEKILRNKRKKAKAKYAANPEAERQKAKDRRLARMAKGICGACPSPALEDSEWCEPCRDVMRARSAERARRRRNPELYVGVPFPKFTTKRPAEQPPAPDVCEPEPEQPNQEQVVLRAARHYDVVTNAELREHLGLPDQDNNRMSVLLSRIRRKGLLERVGSGSDIGWRLTDAGRRAA